jgi:predicted MFS family arabinose efflux permease
MHQPAASEPSLTQGVLLILALSLAGTIGLGLSRFAYALVLSDMRSSLDWSYGDAGLMNTINAAGYLISALIAAKVAASIGAVRTVLAGVVLCTFGIALTALTSHTAVIGLARFLAGIGGALAFIAGGVMAAAIAGRFPARLSLLLGLFYIGPGTGIVISGLVVPAALVWKGPGSWAQVWGILAGLSALCSLVILFALREGRTPARSNQKAAPISVRAIFPLLASYFCFGAGYIAYMTFMIAYVRDNGGSAAEQSLFWIVLGCGGIASPFVWSGMMARIKGGGALMILNGMTAIGTVLPFLSTARSVLLISALIFGLSFLAVVAAITAFVRKNMKEEQWAAALGAATVAFGLGQTISPFATGAITDFTGQLSSVLLVSAGLLVAASAIGSMQRDFPVSTGQIA